MELSVADRIYLLNLDTLPSTGGFLKMKVLTEFRTQLQFTAAELEQWDIRQVDERITWNTEKCKEIEVAISETLLDMVISAIEKSENIPIAAVPLFDKFYQLKKLFTEAQNGGKQAEADTAAGVHAR
jgi:hypothetical protein